LNPGFETDGSGGYPANWVGTCGSCGSFTQVHFDTVSLDATPTPEPGTALAMLGGIAFIAIMRRRET